MFLEKVNTSQNLTDFVSRNGTWASPTGYAEMQKQQRKEFLSLLLNRFSVYIKQIR